MKHFEITEVKRIESEIRVDASQTDCMIYDQRGDWHDIFIDGFATDDLRKWIFDRLNGGNGQYCWSVNINGRRGYIFCEYEREGDGIGGIRFMYRYPRKTPK